MCISFPDHIQVSVSDQGIGIPEGKLSGLFSLENQFSQKGTRDEAGTGLGLILCKEFIHFHEGKIWAESRINEGSSFLFIIPQKEQD